MSLTGLLAVLAAVAAAADGLVASPAWGGASPGQLGYLQGPTRLSLSIPGVGRQHQASPPDYSGVWRNNRRPSASNGAARPRPWWMAPQTATGKVSQQRAGDLNSQFLQLLMREVMRMRNRDTSGRESDQSGQKVAGWTDSNAGLVALPAVPIAFRSFINSPNIPPQCPKGTKVAHDKSCRPQWKRAVS